jgi:predicted amidophosphoribosyltransferase
MEVVAADHPLHNKMIYEPAAVGTSQHDGPPRGDGLTCPTCGLPKESRKHAYCRSCTSAYQRERRIAKGWVPKRRSQSVVCPRCRGPKSGARAYCSECKRQVSQEARDRGRV